MKGLLEIALKHREYGLCVIPPRQDGTKRPDVSSWTQYQRAPPDEAQIRAWYGGERTGIGWVCGKVSHNLEIIDFDDRSIYHEFKRAACAASLGALVDQIERGYLEYTPNGAHWAYRCEEISGNLRLATLSTGKVIIETRGEGGYVIVAPSCGNVHADGVYTQQNGGVESINKISPSDRRSLHNVARLFNERKKTNDSIACSKPQDGLAEDRPGDDYISQTSWSEVLKPHGWIQVYTRGRRTAWRRCGKKKGISATTNHNDSDLLYVFSTSTPFEPERGYNKFSAYTILNHNGDYSAAANELQRLKEEDELPHSDVDISEILKSINKASRKKEFPKKLLQVPGMLGELADHINSTSSKPQPILALGASIAAVATIIGRKVRTENLLRSNVYILGVGETGCGKERARQAIQDIFSRAQAGIRASYDEMASDAAIITAIKTSPSCLFLLDEIGKILKSLASGNAPRYVANQEGIYLKLFGISDKVFYGKSYADPEKITIIEQPNLSIYGTTVPSEFFDSIKSAQISNGFLSRFLIFQSDNPDPSYVDVTDDTPPQLLVEQFATWERWKRHVPNKNQIPHPRTIPFTPQARSTFLNLERTMENMRAQLRSRGEDPSLYTRVALYARKLALIRACGITFEQPVITEIDALWGAELATYLTEQMIAQVKIHATENAIEAGVKKVGQIIKKAGTGGVTKSELTKRTQKYTTNQRSDFIHTLKMSKQIVEKTKKGQSKRPVTYFFWIGE